MGTDWPAAIAAYYRAPAVRTRMAEYCGGQSARPGSFSCEGLAGYGGRNRRVEADGAPSPCANSSFEQLLEEGADVCRALADRNGTLLELDVDYSSPADPGAPYREPEIVFARLEPVHRAVRETLGVFGLTPLVLATGRGYHYVIRAPAGSPLHGALLALGAAGVRASGGRQARAHEGAGRLVEHVVHRVLHRLRGRTEVEVKLADVPPPGGAPFVCLDQSAYGDPVRARYSRCAFSANQKSAVQGAAPERPYAFVVPRGDGTLQDLLRCREDGARASAQAEGARAAIPDVAEAPGLLEDYDRGPLARFHAFFDRGPAVPRDEWRFTYDTLDPEAFPPCVAVPLAFPNPLLLRPASLRTVCFALWALGWHPRSIAGLVRSKYEHDYGWSPPFSRYDPALRARFYVRILCGALADGLDDPDRFTCQSQRQSGLCEPARCSAEAQRLFAALAPSLKLAARI
jgi:hypothetical protein